MAIRPVDGAKRATEIVANELLSIYAARMLAKGIQADPDTPWQQVLEASFPFEETPDQLSALQAVKTDMEDENRWTASSAATSVSEKPRSRLEAPSRPFKTVDKPPFWCQQPSSLSSTTTPSGNALHHFLSQLMSSPGSGLAMTSKTFSNG